MQITITMTSEQMESLEKFRLSQQKVEEHPQTGQRYYVYQYVDVRAMIERQVAGMVQVAMQNYPPQALAAQHNQMKALQEEFSVAAVPAVVSE